MDYATEFNPYGIDWSKLTLADDFFFGYAMKNLDLCKEFLEMLLGTKISEIKHFKQQDYIKHSPSIHAVILDVKLEADGRVINIEMQTTNRADLPLRARYYQAATDIRLLPTGKSYSALPDFLTIFICTFDYFGKKKPVYTIRNTIQELENEEFKDKRKILVYNVTAYKEAFTSDLRDLLNFIKGGVPMFERGKNFANNIGKIKTDAIFQEEYMDYYLKQRELINDTIEKGLSIGIERGMKQGIQQGIQQGMQQGMQQGAKLQKEKDDILLAQKDELIRQLQTRLEEAGLNSSL